jgi:hypothetical protein
MSESEMAATTENKVMSSTADPSRQTIGEAQVSSNQDREPQQNASSNSARRPSPRRPLFRS